MDLTEKRCPFCAETIKAEAIRCKHCHADLDKAIILPADYIDRPKGMGVITKIFLALLALVVAFLGFGFYVDSTPEGKERSKARAAIELCRDREASYEGPEAAREIITGACKLLEKDFRSKFGSEP
ncbi:hypothetical protein ACK56M_09960 [Pseudomonas sp. s4]|uniref:hypothetical protein n=1 Tax=Pseudomonas sp. s4 TaxID=353218 RepID=UPI00398CF7DB